MYKARELRWLQMCVNMRVWKLELSQYGIIILLEMVLNNSILTCSYLENLAAAKPSFTRAW